MLNPAWASARAAANWAKRRALVLDDLHAATATAAGGLDDHGQADALHGFFRLPVGFDDGRAGNHRNAGRLHGLAGGHLVAHGAHDLGLRANPVQAALLHHLGELGVLGQKAVAGVDGVRAGDLGGADERGNIEVALPRRRRADADLLVGEANVQRIGVGGGMDRD